MADSQGMLFSNLPENSAEPGEPILAFEGFYRWLSNFAPSPLTYEGLRYPTVEHAYQAAKTLDPEERHRVAALSTPGLAKRAGRSIQLRDDWEEVKVSVMKELLALKFAQPGLRAKLLATGDRLLVEGNTWNDRFWGQCPVGNGQNMLGRLLMEQRQSLQQQLAGCSQPERPDRDYRPAPF